MKEELSEHSYKVSDEEALEQLKILMEFTTTKSLRKSLQQTFFAYLEEQAGNNGIDIHFKSVVQDYFFLFQFIDQLNSE